MDELLLIENTLKLLRKGKWELEGEEILAFYQVFHAFVNKRKALLPPDPLKPSNPEPIKQPKVKKNKL